jgi:FdrA protein
VAKRLLSAARSAGKPVVVDFIGHASPTTALDNLYFSSTLDGTAELAVELATAPADAVDTAPSVQVPSFATGQQYLRGLYSGGTLAHEALLILQDYLPAVYSNIPLDEDLRLSNSLVSREHTVIDLGEDEFTVGRLHPMMDNTLRIRRLEQEAEDPSVAVIVLDVVLGHGAHPDPASELGPAIAAAAAIASDAGRHLHIVTVLVGTDEDPQGLQAQQEQLESAGAQVVTSHAVALRSVAQRLRSLQPDLLEEPIGVQVSMPVLSDPMTAINVGLESFSESLLAQGARVVQVDWRPPAGGNERLAAILARMGGS